MLHLRLAGQRLFSQGTHGLVPSDVSLTTRIQRFHRHAFICSGLFHANIVPFLGVFSCSQFPYACVFESVGKESLPQHLISNPNASRLRLVSPLILFCPRVPMLTPWARVISSLKLPVVSIISTTWTLSTTALEAYGFSSPRPPRTYYSSRPTYASMAKGPPGLPDSLPPRFCQSTTNRREISMSPPDLTYPDGVALKSFTLRVSD